VSVQKNTMTDDTPINLTRRKALAALGSIGVASAGAGLGTSAYFSDRETFENNQLTAGTLDMKIAWETHYSDWSADEAEFARMPAGGETPTFRLPADGDDERPIELVIEDGPGFLDATRRSQDNGGVFAGAGLCGTGADVPDERVLIDIGDVKPGDFGGAGFRFELCTNPGYLWLTGGLRAASENGTTEPEEDDPDERSDVVELLDAVQVAVGVGTTSDLSAPQPANLLPSTAPSGGAMELVETMSLRTFLQQLGTGPGVPLDADPSTAERDCFEGGSESSPTQYYASVVWWLPVDHANQVQSDEVRFDLGFYTEQCRHNDGVGLSTDLVARYPFDVAAGSTAADVSGNGNDGTLVNGPGATGGQFGDAVSLTGSTDYVAVADDPTLDLTDAFTISAWVETSGTQPSYARLVSREQSGVGNRQYNLGFTPGGMRPRTVVDTGATTSVEVSGSTPITDGNWHHLAITFDATDDLRLYVDGTEEDTTSVSAPVVSRSSDVVLGGVAHTPSSLQYSGALDDVRLYGRALDADEVGTLADT
jgi:predicted ribosomally synthesized peptide with SipW-like signal peptide